MLMNGALFALLEAAFLVFPAWRTLQIRGSYVAHTPDGAWTRTTRGRTPWDGAATTAR